MEVWLIDRSLSSGDYIGAALMVIVAAITSGITGLIFIDIFDPSIEYWIAKSIFWPSDSVRLLPPEFPLARAKIANGDYAGAEADLVALLEKDNGNPHIATMLAELFIDKTRDFRKAEGLLKSYLSKKDRNSGDLPLAMMLADLYLECGKAEMALASLKAEAKKPYNKQSLKALKKRIYALDAG